MALRRPEFRVAASRRLARRRQEQVYVATEIATTGSAPNYRVLRI